MSELEAALRKLKSHNSPGSDQITNEMIINIGSNGMAVSLRFINITWKTGQLPKDWKTAVLIPLLKKNKPKCTIQLQANIIDIMHRETGREDD